VGFWVFTILACAWAFWPESKPKPVFHDAVQRQLKDNASAPSPFVSASGASPSPRPASPAAADKPAEEFDPDPEPLREKLIHITGWIKTATRSMHTFSVSSGGARIFELNQNDLKTSGYFWKPLSECMGYLTYKKTVRTVTLPPWVLERTMRPLSLRTDRAVPRLIGLLRLSVLNLKYVDYIQFQIISRSRSNI
jgi:hypothetical protein